jgi:cytochrome P450
MAVAEVPDVDLLDLSLYRNGMPHEVYAELREVGSVLWHPRTHVPIFGGDIEFWAVIGHREVEQEFELDLFFMVLTFGGSETTRNALTQGLMALLDNPDQLAELRADPSLLPSDDHRTPMSRSAAAGPHFCLGASLARTELRVMIGALLRRFETIEITGEPTWMSAGPAATVGVAVQSLPIRLG